MISININESKRLKFKISVSGVQPQDLKGSLRIMMEKIEYGFPIKIENGNVVVEISPISKIYGKKIKDGSLLDAKLEIIAGDNYLVPWNDKIKLENPIKVEAKIEDVIEELKDIMPKIEVSNISEEETKEKKEIKEDSDINKEIKEDINKKKSKFSMMLEEPKCPEGERYCPIRKKCVPVGRGNK